MKSLISLSLVALLALSGCGGDDNAAAPDGAAGDSSARAPAASLRGETGALFFDRIDADTAYLYANLQRLPEDLVDTMWALNEMSEQTNTQMLEDLSEDDGISEDARSLARKLTELGTREGWEAAGLHSNPMYAIHALSVFPVIHLELADSAAFRARLAEIEADLDSPMTRRDVDGTEILWMDFDDSFGLALNIEDAALTAALIPDQAALLARVAGRTEPADPMGSNALETLNSQKGLTAHGSGYMDLRRVVAEVLSPNPALAELDSEGKLEELRNDPACAAEFDALTTAIPRMIVGYTAMNNDRIDFLWRMETSSTLGSGLAPIARSPVGIDRELSGLFNFGLAFDLIAARDFARGLVNGWVENPPQCAAFSNVAEQAPQMQSNLNRPIPPVVTNLHGMFLEATSFEMGPDGIPTGGGTLTFFMNNPQLLVGMAQMFSPALAALQLEPGGDAQRVPQDALPQLAASGLEAWMAMGSNSVGLAVGEDQVPAMQDGLERREADAFLMTGAIDFTTLVSIMDMAEQSLDDESDQSVLAMQRQQYEQMAEYYDQAVIKIALGETGIDFIAETHLK